MVINSAAKLAIGTLTLGTVSTVGYFGSSYFANNQKKIQRIKISDLIDEKYTHILLRTNVADDDSHWATAWKSYETDSKKKDKDIFGLEGWNKEKPEDLTNKLKEKCAELRKLNVINDDDSTYQNVTKYCARDVTISDNASKDKLKAIENSDGNQAIWQARENNKANLTKELKVLGVDDNSQNSATIKQKCIDAKNKKKSDLNYYFIYQAYKLVCVKKEGE